MNNLPLGTIPARPRRRRRRRQTATSAAPAALTLVAANYDADVLVVLEFDRAIDITDLDGAQITLDDPNESILYAATGPANLLTPTMLEIIIQPIGEATGSSVTLTASADTGIVAVDDGETWAGVTDLVLPWP